MARAALQIDQDDALGFAEASLPNLLPLGRLQLQHVAERHAGDHAPANSQDIPAGYAEVGIANIFAKLTRDAEHGHGGKLQGSGRDRWGR